VYSSLMGNISSCYIYPLSVCTPIVSPADVADFTVVLALEHV